jgi:exonuclease III
MTRRGFNLIEGEEKVGACFVLMKLKILSWNVRGINELDKRLRIKGLIRDWKVDLVCLMETKMEVITREVVRSLWGCQHVDWCFMGASGASGGILIMWDRRAVEKVDDCVGRYTLAVSLRNVDDNFLWAFWGVYGPNDDGERRVLWNEMTGLMSWWDRPWCFGGDFNVVRFPSERSGVGAFSAAMEEFSEFIHGQSLVDIPLQGGQFTWSNNQVWSKIDRFLLSPEWEEHFPDVSQSRLPRLLLDHFPLMLDYGV